MIFIDTGAIYALVDRRDSRHRDAVGFFEETSSHEAYVLTLPVLTETCWMLETRLGQSPARTLWEDVVHGVFDLYQLDLVDLARALDIERLYSDAAIGFTDACSLAATERLGIQTVFTFDRRDFSVYRTPAGSSLRLVP